MAHATHPKLHDRAAPIVARLTLLLLREGGQSAMDGQILALPLHRPCMSRTLGPFEQPLGLGSRLECRQRRRYLRCLSEY